MNVFFGCKRKRRPSRKRSIAERGGGNQPLLGIMHQDFYVAARPVGAGIEFALKPQQLALKIGIKRGSAGLLTLA